MLDHESYLREFLGAHRWLAAYLRAAVCDTHVAEDLLQSVAQVLWQKVSEYDPARPFTPLALGVARLEVIKWRRQAARSREVISEEAMQLLAETAAEEAAAVDQRQHFLAECLKGLAGTARRVLELKYADELKVAEIAARLQKSPAAVEMVLVRSRRGLRACIERKMALATRPTA